MNYLLMNYSIMSSFLRDMIQLARKGSCHVIWLCSSNYWCFRHVMRFHWEERYVFNNCMVNGNGHHFSLGHTIIEYWLSTACACLMDYQQPLTPRSHEATLTTQLIRMYGYDHKAFPCFLHEYLVKLDNQWQFWNLLIMRIPKQGLSLTLNK